MSEPQQTPQPQNEGTPWNPVTMGWICCNADLIREYARKTGASAKAIAGFLAKENDWYVKDNARQLAVDYLAVVRFAGMPDPMIYEDAKKALEIVAPDPTDKAIHPTSVDLGPGNIQIATAIRLLESYRNLNYPNDPLDLLKYAENYHKLINVLATPGNHCGGDETTRLTVALAALMVKEAQDFFSTKIRWSVENVLWWGEQSLVFRDGLYVTYCVFGQKQMEQKWKERTG